MADKTKKELMYAALKVIALDPVISKWLSENDPKALEQVRNAIIQQVEHCEIPHSGSCSHPYDAACRR